MLAEILGEHGYRTMGFNTNPNLSKTANFHQGFNDFFQFLPYLETAFFSTIHFNIVRDGRWKYRLAKNASEDRLPAESLYDLVADPIEENDVAELHPERVVRMRRQFEVFAEALARRSPPPDALPISPQEEIDQQELERLEALGYIEN